MILLDTADPDQPRTWAPRNSELLSLYRCGVALVPPIPTIYQIIADPGTQAVVTPSSGFFGLPEHVGKRAWIQYASLPWLSSTVLGLSGDPAAWIIAAIDDLPATADPCIFKIVKYWTM